MDIEKEEEKDTEKRHCRICYSEESVDEKLGPDLKFLSPCKCKGTSQYLHFSCLKEWLESKRILQKTNLPALQNQPTASENYLTQIHNYLLSVGIPSAENFTDILNGVIPFNPNANPMGPLPQEQPAPSQNNVKNYTFANFCCDVCRENLPFSIITNKGDEYETVDVPRPDKEPYILFERMSQGKEQKLFSVIKGIPNYQAKLGRGHASDIVISDISVSRFHAFIKYQNGAFYLFDKNSKFGTLVQLQGPLLVQREKVGIQCGRTLITFSVREKKSKDEEIEVLGSISKLVEEMSMVAAQNGKKVQSQKKKGQSLKNMTKKKEIRDGGSEGTLDVEEIAPPANKELNDRSKKINKRKNRTSKK